MTEQLEHIWPPESGPLAPGDFERERGLRYCRRCCRLLWSERHGNHDPKPCEHVRIGLR